MQTSSKNCLAVLVAAVSFAALPGVHAADNAAAPVVYEKNWKAPAHKMVAQTVVDDVMTKHPELLSMTFHGAPPATKGIYTMFAGSFPERIGKVSSADDVACASTGVTIIDPRWGKEKTDPIRKFIVMIPLRDAQVRNVGCIVFAFKNPAGSNRSASQYLDAATALRESIQSRIPGHAEMFAAVGE
jgi:hypothetical protein